MRGSTTSRSSTPTAWAKRILDMGDILSLIEQAQKAFDEDEAMEIASKLATENFTLDDFLKQMQQLRKAGNFKKMMGMLPGMGQMKEALENFDERELVRTEAIIQSMTTAERQNPKLLNGSRRADRPWLRPHGHGRQRARQALRTGREDDEDRRSRRHPAIPGMGPIPGRTAVARLSRRAARRSSRASAAATRRSAHSRRSKKPRPRSAGRRLRRRRIRAASGWRWAAERG